MSPRPGQSWNNGPVAKTRAIQALERAGIPFQVHYYHVDSADGPYGEAVAEAVGVRGDRMFKTLIASVDGRPMVGIVPVERQLSLKALAKAALGKRAHMVETRDAERLTGYVVGGISPFGRTRKLPVFLDQSALDHETVYVSGGQRGIQLEIAPDLLVAASSATPAAIAD
jgi:Cys-tRNA(Pro)/Cys-tRNA(Cys) deacylase